MFCNFINKEHYMKKFLSLILVFCLVICGGIFAGCGNKEIVLSGGPAYDDNVYGNGGFVVTKGNYVYFTDAYIKSSSLGSKISNQLGSVTETGLYRARKAVETVDASERPILTDIQLMVSKVVGFENSGLYIFKDKIYFATPTTDKDKTGTRYDLITFYSCNLDGSNLKKLHQTTKFSSGKFSMTMIDGNVYLLIYTGSEIIRVSENGEALTIAEKVTGAILPSRETIVSNDENPKSSECFVYYTINKESDGPIDRGNILYKAEISTGKTTELLNKDRIKVTVKALCGGRLFYVRNELFGSTSVYSYYSNSLAENFEAGETKQLSESSLDVFVLGEYEGNNLGLAYVNSNKSLIIRNIDSELEGENFASSVNQILFSRNGYLYYATSDAVYRKSLTNKEEEKQKLSGSLTIKTDYFDVDDEYLYFFAEDKAKGSDDKVIKTTEMSLYRVQLSSAEKTPVKMA